MSLKKIYTDDPMVHYKDSTVTPERTKAEIDGILAEWAIKDTQWHWDPTHSEVWLMFRIEETVGEIPVLSTIKVKCPTIWAKASPRSRPPRTEQIDWRVSMRAMHWFIKTHLEMAYVMHSAKTRAFLANVSVDERKDLGDLAIAKLSEIQSTAALPFIEKKKEVEKE